MTKEVKSEINMNSDDEIIKAQPYFRREVKVRVEHNNVESVDLSKQKNSFWTKFGFVIFFISMLYIRQYIMHKAVRPPSIDEMTVENINRMSNETANEFLKTFVEVMNENLPLKTDEITTFENVDLRNGKLIFYNTIDESIDSRILDSPLDRVKIKAALREHINNNKNHLVELVFAASKRLHKTIVYRYKFKSDNRILDIDKYSF